MVQELSALIETTVTIKRSARRKHLQIQVEPDQSVTIFAPQKMSERVIKTFVKEKQYWISEKQQYYKTHTLPIVQEGEWKDMHKNLARARKLFRDVVKHWNAHYQFSYSTIRVKRMKSRWGSCNSQGVLTFNYDLLFLEPELLDYVVVHELCHLEQMNHSRAFWKLVGHTIPDYKKRVTKLKKYILE